MDELKLLNERARKIEESIKNGKDFIKKMEGWNKDSTAYNTTRPKVLIPNN